MIPHSSNTTKQDGNIINNNLISPSSLYTSHTLSTTLVSKKCTPTPNNIPKTMSKKYF